MNGQETDKTLKNKIEDPQTEIIKSKKHPIFPWKIAAILFNAKPDLMWHEAIYSPYWSCLVWIFICFAAEMLMDLISDPAEGVR